MLLLNLAWHLALYLLRKTLSLLSLLCAAATRAPPDAAYLETALLLVLADALAE